MLSCKCTIPIKNFVQDFFCRYSVGIFSFLEIDYLISMGFYMKIFIKKYSSLTGAHIVFSKV